MNIIFDFKNKSNIHDILDILYQTINDSLGETIMFRGRHDKIIWDAYYDDLFCALSGEEFISEFGDKVHLIFRNLNEFKTAEPENYKMFLESTIGYQLENLYKYGKVHFSYEIKD